MRILVVNAGSASLELKILSEDDRPDGDTYLDTWDGSVDTAAAAMTDLIEGGERPACVGHRVVHGGDVVSATEVSAEVVDHIRGLTPLAPLHQPRALAGIEAAQRVLPDVRHVACFDTAFHTTLPPAARTYALPAEWRERWGLQRFGFHGLSHAWVAERVPELLDVDGSGLRIVSCHLGGGSSLCAVLSGRSIDTTMGFTPLEGLVMKTRAGSVDPGLVLWLIREAGLDPDEVAEGLDRRSGVAGLSGTSGDVRDVFAAMDRGDPDAQLAMDVNVHRLRHGIAAMAASLGGIDVLTFTGGAGENSMPLRALTCEGLAFLGVELDPALNDTATTDADISAGSAAVRTVVVTSREDLEIARQARALLGKYGHR